MSEKILWDSLRNGDSKALESIYRTYFSVLFDYGKKLSRDENTVEDCIQELFVELWNRRERLTQTDSIKPYLMVALRRKIFNTIKKLRKSLDTELEEQHFHAELSIDEILIASETSAEQKNKLLHAFKELSDRQKEILYLKYYSEMSYDDISKIMEMNYQSARNLVSRALQKLSKHMMVFWCILFGKRLADMHVISV